MKKNKLNQATPKKHRFNFIDLFVVLVIVVVIGVALLWLDPLSFINKESAEQEKTILFVVEVKDVSTSNVNKLAVNDDVLFSNEGVNIGKIVDISIAPSYTFEIAKDEDQMILVENSNKNTLYITVEIECIYKKDVGYFLNDFQLLVGKTIGFESPMLEVNGECVSIQVKE